MAGTAEAETHTSWGYYPEELAVLAIGDFRDIDTIPELQGVRTWASQRATEIFDQNREFLREGEYDSVPLPIDSMGTARHVAEVERRYGKDSSEYREAFEGLFLDCQRLWAEGRHKNAAEYFPPVVQRADPNTGDFYYAGVRLLDIVERGLSPIVSSQVERTNRASEFREEVTYTALPKLIGRLAIEDRADIITVSECPDWAIEAYEKDSKSAFEGYVPGIKKLMIRGVRFPSPGERVEEQVAVKGEWITHDVIMATLKARGALASNAQLNKEELRAKQFINTHNEGGVLGFQADLDKMASKMFGRNIFMGEEVPPSHPKDYETVKVEAVDRQSKSGDDVMELTRKIIELEQNNTDRWAANTIIDEWLNQRFIEIAKVSPAQAEIMFDKQTAITFTQAAEQRALGNHDAATLLEARAIAEAPPVTYCGAGSCGLSAASPENAEKAKKLGLNGELIHDDERPCPDCQTLNVYYDQTGNKACINCSKTTVQ
jgi:hypothetical protein